MSSEQPTQFAGPQHITFEHGFQQVVRDPENYTLRTVGPAVSAKPTSEEAHYQPPPSVPIATSVRGNAYGTYHDHSYPSLLNGTNAPQGPPAWFKKEKEVDVVICGAGPAGLEVAVSLLRQGVSFRIIDKAPGPLPAGRADGVQPRFLETLSTFGLATEVAEEGPLIEHTAFWKDGRCLLFDGTHTSDSRYRGLHIITQTQVEGIYIRDLLRHRRVVERLTSVKSFEVDEAAGDDNSGYPVTVTLVNQQTGEEEIVRCKHLVGADGASSTIRKQIGIKFEGVSTDVYWGIVDAKFEGTYPHLSTFGLVISSQYGGICMVPREDGMLRFYVQLDPAAIADKRQIPDGGAPDMGTITPDEVLEQANRILYPHNVRYSGAVSWFTVWKISERVAERYSHKNRVHLTGDACHVHSVMGAFGLNASILDASNLAWKLGLAIRSLAPSSVIMPTYEHERRRHATRIIETSGVYLRFVCSNPLGVVKLGGVGTEPREEGDDDLPLKPWEEGPGGEERDRRWMASFFGKNSNFLLGIDFELGHNVLNPARATRSHPTALKSSYKEKKPTTVRWGVRAPNPRVTLTQNTSGYLYDTFGGPSKFAIVIFGSDIHGPVVHHLSTLTSHLSSPTSFYNRYGGSSVFKVVFISKVLPLDLDDFFASGSEEAKALGWIRENSTIVYDDQLPGRGAHDVYGVDHACGAVAVIRPDLYTGITVYPDEGAVLDEYFARFLLPQTA